jgi:hypothetical protein
VASVVPLAASAGPVVVSLLVSLAALAISAISLWRSALKPADLVVEHLPEDSPGVRGGGTNNVPAVYTVQLVMEQANLGARAGLLQSIKVVKATSPGADGFATGVRPPRYGQAMIAETGAGETAAFPRTVEPGEVRAYVLHVELEGALLTAEGTTPTPALEPLAELLRDLERVDLAIECKYRRRGILQRQVSGATYVESVSIPGEDFRRLAVEFWTDHGKVDHELADVVQGIARAANGDPEEP